MKTTTDELVNKRGFLHESFHFFELQDYRELHIESHYHDFYKLVIFLTGKGVYYIDGAAYDLHPWDLLLINRDMLHKPEINPALPYKRIILWLNPAFVSQLGARQTKLAACFEQTAQKRLHRFCPTEEQVRILQPLLQQLSAAAQKKAPDDELFCRALLTQLLIILNRMEAGTATAQSGGEKAGRDENIGQLLRYIDVNLAKDLSVETLASHFFLSKYYLMRKFKQQTGYSLHQYILQKRLIAANQLLRGGYSVMSACLESGFRDYANFARAFKKQFGRTPGNKKER